jgi:hypothetical protein
MHPEDYSAVMSAFIQGFRSGSAVRAVYRYRHKTEIGAGSNTRQTVQDFDGEIRVDSRYT